MKTSHPVLLAALTCLALSAPGRADVPSFKNRDSIDKAFLKQVGEAAVKAVRSMPVKLELDDFKISDPKPNRKVITIKMTWQGALSRKKFTSDIKITVDPTEKDRWEVLDVEYDDDNPVKKLGFEKHIKALKADLNR